MPRIFPKTDQELLLDFTYVTNRIERIPIPVDEVKGTLNKTCTPNPYIAGQLTCINLIKRLATNDDLIPREVSYADTLDHLSFLKRIHLNMMKPIAVYQENIDEPNPYPLAECGQWRYSRKFILQKEMPSPHDIHNHLFNWLSDLADFQNEKRHKIETVQAYDENDIEEIVAQCYEANLKLCCIKPFTDGSNRLARLTEQLLRLNFGLPWKVIRHDDSAYEPYIDDIREMQKEYTN